MPVGDPVKSEDQGLSVWVVVAVVVLALGLLSFPLWYLIQSVVEADLSFSVNEEPHDTATLPDGAVEEEQFASAMVFFEDFSSEQGMTLVGTARFSDGAVSLTRKAEGSWQYGAAWYEERLPVGDGFEAAFVFQIDHVSWFTIGHGLAFVVQNASGNALGDPEGAGGPGYRTITNSIAIEFDTVHQNYLGDPRTAMPADAPDLLANHVAIHTNGSSVNTNHSRHSIASAGLPILLADRQIHTVLVRYQNTQLTIFVDDLAEPVLTTTIDLDTLGLTKGTGFVGFTAGTDPGFYSDHRILGWAFNSPCLTEDCDL